MDWLWEKFSIPRPNNISALTEFLAKNFSETIRDYQLIGANGSIKNDLSKRVQKACMDLSSVVQVYHETNSNAKKSMSLVPSHATPNRNQSSLPSEDSTSQNFDLRLHQMRDTIIESISHHHPDIETSSLLDQLGFDEELPPEQDESLEEPGRSNSGEKSPIEFDLKSGQGLDCVPDGLSPSSDSDMSMSDPESSCEDYKSPSPPSFQDLSKFGFTSDLPEEPIRLQTQGLHVRDTETPTARLQSAGHLGLVLPLPIPSRKTPLPFPSLPPLVFPPLPPPTRTALRRTPPPLPPPTTSSDLSPPPPPPPPSPSSPSKTSSALDSKVPTKFLRPLPKSSLTRSDKVFVFGSGSSPSTATPAAKEFTRPTASSSAAGGSGRPCAPESMKRPRHSFLTEKRRRPDDPRSDPTKTLGQFDAYKEYLDTRALPPRPSTESSVPRERFISHDQSENDDNDPSRWSSVRGLKSDIERKMMALRQFGNLELSDPTQNLTYFGCRRKIKAKDSKVDFKPLGGEHISKEVRIIDGRLEKISKRTSPSKRKRPASPEVVDKRAFIPFDHFAAELVRKVKEHRLPDMTKVCKPNPSVITYDQRPCTPQLLCNSCWRRRESYWKLYLSHFKAGMIDTEKFLNFYLGSSSETKANHLQVPENLLGTTKELERIFGLFNSLYGPNETRFCRDCQTSHVF